MIGFDENMEELKLMVEYLHDPNKFQFIGARSPHGVLFTGPPGTGKTMLARAVAGEAQVPFFFVAGSEFEEVFVGVGAKRVRKLFETARKSAPCIVFIDELDAVGGNRDEIGGNNNTRQTINQLLNEIGGFRGDEGVLVIAATNLKESLDPALIRAGRFDLEVHTSLPDYASRLKMLKLKSKNYRLAPDVDLEYFARVMVGNSGADIETLLNVATMRALADGSNLVTKQYMEESRERLTMGVRKPSVEDESVNYHTAVHEGGHALLSILTPNYPKVDKITIVPRGSALGYVSNLMDEKFLYSMTKTDLINRIDVALAGRAAEEVILGENKVSTGASNDLEKATNIVLSMVYQYGLTDCGLRTDPVSQNPMLPSLPLYSQKTIAMNDQVIEQILQERYAHVKSVIRENKKKLLRLVDYLVKNETVSGDNAIRILNGKKPIVESSDGSKEAKEISDAYFQLSLVDHYSIRDGKLVDRVPQEECVHFFDEVIKDLIESFDPENLSSYDQSLIRHLNSLTLRDKAEVFDKYAGMIYNDSLKNINVREVLERVKAQNYPCLFHFT